MLLPAQEDVFSQHSDGQVDPISYDNMVHWGNPYGLFGAYKRAMKLNRFLSMTKKDFKEDEFDWNEDYEDMYDNDYDNDDDYYMDDTEDSNDEMEIQVPEKKDGSNFWATRGKRDGGNFWATRGKKSGDFWAVRGYMEDRKQKGEIWHITSV